jgi:hypothetical protein
MRTLFVLAVWTVYALCHLNGFHTYPCVDWKMRTAWPRYVASHPLVDAKEAPAPTAGNHSIPSKHALYGMKCFAIRCVANGNARQRERSLDAINVCH